VLGYSVLSGTGAGIVYATCAATVASGARRSAPPGSVSSPSDRLRCRPFIVAFAAALTPASRTGIFTAVGVIILVVVAQIGALLRDPPAGWCRRTSTQNSGPSTRN
jgi:hypothetical protein